MAHSTIDVQTELVWSGTTFTIYGTGRHRGPQADDDQRRTGNETIAGHGRHRKISRTSSPRPVDGTDSPWV
ncbi:hypothetical protein OG206_01675 [Streptomyces sp. NBC_01341]|uniref:hypothetical protein n=1 Tax=Streptomyces sp. NBC_01341 TaxID=2903831 RepID=UPI002E1642D1|nr:hypothetical protein OG206_01675 [Streptomyces sp. NBC_01341]